MGLFDNIVKAVKDSGLKEALENAGKGISEAAKEAGIDTDKLKEEFKSTGSSISSGNTVPEKYTHFPQFAGEISDLSTKAMNGYERCTIDYKESTKEAIDEYRKQAEEAGYKKATDVRYEKDNEYIIIDPDDTYMHLVFHIKNK